jgi:hypothetical protein
LVTGDRIRIHLEPRSSRDQFLPNLPEPIAAYELALAAAANDFARDFLHRRLEQLRADR